MGKKPLTKEELERLAAHMPDDATIILGSSDDVTPDKLAKIVGVEVLRTGTFTDMNGKVVTFTGDDLDQIVKNFNDLKGRLSPRIKLAHKKTGFEKGDGGSFEKDGDGFPKLGIITALSRDNDKLVATFDQMPQKLAQLVANKAYDDVSSEVVATDKLGFILLAVTLLGEDIPAVSDLNADGILDLYKGEDKASAELSSGGRIFCFGLRDRFEKEIDERLDALKDLNWAFESLAWEILWDDGKTERTTDQKIADLMAALDEYKGLLESGDFLELVKQAAKSKAALSKSIKELVFKLSGNPPDQNISANKGGETTMETVEKKIHDATLAELESKKGEITALSGKISGLEASGKSIAEERDALKAENAALKEQVERGRIAELSAFVDGLVKDGKVAPSAKSATVRILSGADAVTKLSAGDGNETELDAMKREFSALPANPAFVELSKGGAVAPKPENSDDALEADVLKFCKDHNLNADNFEDRIRALAAVDKNNDRIKKAGD